MTGFIILIILMLSLLLFLVERFSKSYRMERVRLEDAVANEVVTRIENIRTFGEEKTGWRNNFPSRLGWERTTLQIGRDFVLVTGKSKFPFLFKSEIQPFVISLEPQPLISRLGYASIFRPSNIRTTNFGSDLELTIRPSGALGEIEVRLTFESVGKGNLEKLFEITNWR
jgi:hypothetical protein